VLDTGHNIKSVVHTGYKSACLALFAGEPAVVVKGEFTWDLAAPATLMDMDVSVPAGSFVAIVGPTGGCIPNYWDSLPCVSLVSCAKMQHADAYTTFPGDTFGVQAQANVSACQRPSFRQMRCCVFVERRPCACMLLHDVAPVRLQVPGTHQHFALFLISWRS
jgi:hypothetical protein